MGSVKDIFTFILYNNYWNLFENIFLIIGGAMELGEINSGESSKNQLVEIQIEGNIQFLYNKSKISLKSMKKIRCFLGENY